ncbi:hypothetical protein Tco_0645021 [Tanacetum coccineum]
MSNLKFAETHNLVAFLEKPEESDGFEEIIDFLNASSIRYALTVNPTIYTSCIKQFWATAKAKTVNGEVQIQALVDGKKVIVTETRVRRALQLKDVEAPEELGEGSEIPIDPQYTPTIIQPSTSQPQKKQQGGNRGLDAQEDASKHGRKFADLDADAEVTLVDEAQGRNDDLMFYTGVFDEQEVVVEKLKNKSFVEVQKAFDKTMGWIDSFVSMDSKVMKGGGKEKDEGGFVTRAKEESTDGSSKRYSLMIKMLQNIDKEDLETLWKFVKAKHGSSTAKRWTYESVYGQGIDLKLGSTVPPTNTDASSLQELDLLFSPLYEEYFTAGNQSVSKPFALSDNLQQQDTQPSLNVQPTIESITPPTNVNIEENNTDQAADMQFEPYEFINPLCTLVQEIPESSSRNVDTSNMQTFYQ